MQNISPFQDDSSGRQLSIIACTFVIHLGGGLVGLIIIGPTDNDENIRSFLTSGLQVVSAMASIIFAISIIAIQHTANTFSPTFLDFYLKDKFVLFIIIHNIATIIAMATTILYDWNIIVNIIFIVFVWNAILLVFYLKHTLHIINPLFIISKNELIIINDLINIKQKISLDNKSFLSENISHPNLLQNTKNHIAALDNIIYTSYTKHDYESTTRGLQSYGNIIEKYIEIQNNQIIIYDEIFKDILTKNYAYMITSLKDENDIFLMQLIDNNKKMADEILKMEINYTLPDDSPLNELLSFLIKFSKKCIDKNNFDFYIAIMINCGELGSMVADKTKIDHTVTKKLLEMGYSTLDKNFEACRECINQYLIILDIKTQSDNQQLKYDIGQLKIYIKKVINYNTNNIHSNFIDYTHIEKYVYNIIQYQKNNSTILHENLSDIMGFINFIIEQSKNLNDMRNSMIDTLGIIKNICVDNIIYNDIDLYDVISEIDSYIVQYSE